MRPEGEWELFHDRDNAMEAVGRKFRPRWRAAAVDPTGVNNGPTTSGR